MSKKPLPQIKTLQYDLELPITGKKIVYRPYNVRDERILLAASQARKTDTKFYIENTINVIQGTVLNEIDVSKLPAVETRLLMLRLRGKSVGEEISFKTTNDEGVKEDITVNTDDFFIVMPEDPKFYHIALNDEISLEMKNVSFGEEASYASRFEQNPTDSIFETIIDSVKSVYTKEDVWIVGTDITKEEVRPFIEDLSGLSSKLYEFLRNRPKIAVKALVNGKEQIINENEADFLA